MIKRHHFKTTGREPDVECTERCRLKNNGTMIGSASCQECEHHLANDLDEFGNISWIACRKIEEATTAPSKTTLVAAFPGTGKSHCASIAQGKVSDSDSSKFDKTGFPENYIEHVKEKIAQEYDMVFVSSHKEVRNALVSHKLPFVLIYPSAELKDEYVERYRRRGNNEKFIRLLSDNWDAWIGECKAQPGCRHVELKSGQFVCDAVKNL